MSDAGRKMDVEDVLSSIRRLVSEEARSEPAPQKTDVTTSKPASPIAARPSSPAHEKLVLTTAFRIPEPSIPDETGLETAAEPAQENPTEAGDAHPDSPVLDALPDGIALNIDPVSDFGFDASAMIAEQTESPSMDLQSSIPELPAELEPRAPVEPEPETVDAEPDTPEMVEEPVADSENSVSAPQLSVVEQPAEPQKTVETAEPEPAHPIHSTAYDAIDYTATETGLLDEDTLRELVSEMVRSELQGELGDRITRNVRKLVRREIHRALASRDFD